MIFWWKAMSLQMLSKKTSPNRLLRVSLTLTCLKLVAEPWSGRITARRTAAGLSLSGLTP